MITQKSILILCLSLLFGCRAYHLDSPYQWKEGESFSFPFTYHNSSSYDLQKLFEDLDSTSNVQPSSQSLTRQEIQTFAGGNMSIVFVKKRKDGFLARVQIDQLVTGLISNGINATEQADQIRKDLEIPFFIQLGKRGSIDSIWIDPSINEMARNYTVEILSLSQFCFPDSIPASYSKWVVVETEPNGKFEVQYELVDESGLYKVFRKDRIKFLIPPLLTFNEQIPKSIQPSGSLSITFNVKEGYLISSIGIVTNEIFLSSKKVADTETNFELNFKERSETSDKILEDYHVAFANLQRQIDPTTLVIQQSEEQGIENIQQQELGKETLETLLTKLEKSEKSGKEMDVSLTLKFEALAYLHPEVCDQLAKMIKTASPGGAKLQVLTGALVGAGHEKAQNALLKQLLDSTLNEDILNQLMFSVANIKKPIKQVDKVLKVIATKQGSPFLKEPALIALGRMAHRTKQTDQERTTSIFEWLRENLLASQNIKDQEMYLSALGYTANESILPIIYKYFQTNQPLSLRTRAVGALAFLDFSLTKSIFTQAARDPFPDIRQRAARVLRKYPPSLELVKFQESAMTTEPDPIIGLYHLRSLWYLKDEFPEEIRNLMIRLTENTMPDYLREEAQKIIDENETFFKLRD